MSGCLLVLGAPAARSFDSTGAASASAGDCDEVRPLKWVSALAGRLASVYCCGRKAAPGVDCHRHRLHVPGVDAGSISAQVVDHQVRRDRSNVVLIRPAMYANGAPIRVRELAVSITVKEPLPDPAVARTQLNASSKSLLGGNGRAAGACHVRSPARRDRRWARWAADRRRARSSPRAPCGSPALR